jgi:uncharacterized protein (DUF1778 family)
VTNPEWRPTVKLTVEQFDELVDVLEEPDPAPNLERAAQRYVDDLHSEAIRRFGPDA